MTQISIFWFDKLKHITPTHFVTANVDEMPEEVQKYKDQLEGRVMLVKKAKVIPLEAIVRGYLTGGHGDVPADSLFDLLTLGRLCMVGIQEKRNSSRNHNAFWSDRISKTLPSLIHPFNEGRVGAARREYLSSTR